MSSETAANPVLVEVTRGDMVESRHRGAVAVVDAKGAVVQSWGDIERPVYARSALKPIQALPLIETGAADAFNLSAVEIALACASHSGEPAHISGVRDWLVRIGLSEENLQCGPHLPYNSNAAADLLRAGGDAAPIYNNCSGKHVGFLTTAVHLGEPKQGYILAEHPVQRRIKNTLVELCQEPLNIAPTGIDGCGIPVIGLSLRATAFGMAKLADPSDLKPARREAARVVVDAMLKQPFMIAGSERFGTIMMQHLGQKAAIKIGAEGVFTAILPNRGLGIALKIDDGAARAAEIAIGAVLDRLNVLNDKDRAVLRDVLQAPVLNRASKVVGRVRPAREWIED